MEILSVNNLGKVNTIFIQKPDGLITLVTGSGTLYVGHSTGDLDNKLLLCDNVQEGMIVARAVVYFLEKALHCHFAVTREAENFIQYERRDGFCSCGHCPSGI